MDSNASGFYIKIQEKFDYGHTIIFVLEDSCRHGFRLFLAYLHKAAHLLQHNKGKSPLQPPKADNWKAHYIEGSPSSGDAGTPSSGEAGKIVCPLSRVEADMKNTFNVKETSKHNVEVPSARAVNHLVQAQSGKDEPTTDGSKSISEPTADSPREGLAWPLRLAPR